MKSRHLDFGTCRFPDQARSLDTVEMSVYMAGFMSKSGRQSGEGVFKGKIRKGPRCRYCSPRVSRPDPRSSLSLRRLLNLVQTGESVVVPVGRSVLQQVKCFFYADDKGRRSLDGNAGMFTLIGMESHTTSSPLFVGRAIPTQVAAVIRVCRHTAHGLFRNLALRLQVRAALIVLKCPISRPSSHGRSCTADPQNSSYRYCLQSALMFVSGCRSRHGCG